MIRDRRAVVRSPFEERDAFDYELRAARSLRGASHRGGRRTTSRQPARSNRQRVAADRRDEKPGSSVATPLLMDALPTGPHRETGVPFVVDDSDSAEYPDR
jgi:hypothetical protein